MTFPVLLFAAGKGTRMGDLTLTQPKPLISVAGHPLIDHALTLIEAADTGKKVVNLHYKADMLRHHLTDRDVTFSDETDLLRETGGGLRHATPLLGHGPCITMNTDAVWNGPNPVRQIMSAWQDRMEALLLLIPRKNVHGHLGKGDFLCGDDGRLQRGPGLIYSGLQIIRPETVAGIPEPVFSLNVAWDKIMERGKLFGVVYDGQWCDVGQPSSIPIAEEMLRV